MYRSKLNYLHGNPNIISRHAKLQRLKAKGLLPTKAELNELCRAATSNASPAPDQPIPTPKLDSLSSQS